MLIYPAIDLFEGKAVRLLRGDYNNMTVYENDPTVLAKRFSDCGAKQMHIVDLEGARNGSTPNMDVILSIKKAGGLFCEVGGGIRDLKTAETYLSHEIDRVILGTAAVTEKGFVEKAFSEFGSGIAVGIDIRDGYVAIKGWTEQSGLEAISFCQRMEQIGVQTLIVTDISKDGALNGTNHELYHKLTSELHLQIIASGGVSSSDDIVKLKNEGLYGAIIGKAYYTGAINLSEAIEVAK